MLFRSGIGITSGAPMTSAAKNLRIASMRPQLTTAITFETGLDESVLRDLVDRFYAKVRADPNLGPIFQARITDWGTHLKRMVSFWSSVVLMTGTYRGRPVPAHTALPVTAAHFSRWLELFRETAREVCPPAGAEHVIARAERIAHSLQRAVWDAQAGSVTAAASTGEGIIR